MKKLISISLYGNVSMYKKGLESNIDLLPKIFPDWTIRIYTDADETYSEYLKNRNCEVVSKPLSQGHSGMFWRFLAAWDNEADRVIFRDSDSRLNVREAEAVKAWENSGLDAHCMHDHEHHSCFPLFGGMWGIKCNILSKSLFRECFCHGKHLKQRMEDMNWLRDKVHPIIENSIIRHSSIFTKWPFVPFPPHSDYKGFVGQQYDEKGNPIWP